MGKFYSPLILLVLLLITALAFSHSKESPIERREEAKSVAARRSNPINITASKPFTLMGTNSVTQNNFQTDTTSILNVKVFPIPVTDEMNVSYHLKKDSNVIIQIWDVIGNKIATLFSQR